MSALIIYIIVLFIFISVLKLALPYLKGKVGEYQVSQQAKAHLSEEYVLLDNITLPDGDGGTTQIDHVILSPFGIFVIETKNYTGWIFGTARQKQWTQQIYKKKFKFQNPIHQNYKHIQVLATVFSSMIDPIHLHSVIVFSNQCEFKTQMPANVCRGKTWLNYIQQFQNTVINADQIQQIQDLIDQHRLEASLKTDFKHVQHLKNRTQKGFIQLF